MTTDPSRPALPHASGEAAAEPLHSAARSADAHRIEALDGVRGLAILGVILCHCVVFASAEPSGGLALIYERSVSRGRLGVDLFFVLSGFLITGILYDAKKKTRFFRTFYARRTLRIFPAYYLALVLGLLVAPAVFRVPSVSWRPQAYAWTYLTNVLFAEQGWSVLPTYTNHFWSLAVEEQFYLVWPLLVFLLPRRRLIGVCAVALVVALGARYWWEHDYKTIAAYVMTVARLDDLAAGALLALVARGPTGLTRAAPLAWPAAFAGAAAFAIISWMPGPFPTTPVGLALLPAAACLLFAATVLLAITAQAGNVRRFFSAAPLRFLGKYSYALYIVHQPLVLALRTTMLAPRRVALWSHSPLAADMMFVVVELVAAIAVALLSWHFWEQPFLRLKGRFRYQS